MDSLPLFHRIAGKPVIVLGEGEAADAKRRLVERVGGVVVSEGNTDARLAFIALTPPEDAAHRLRARGVLINTVDRPDLCDFTVPSLLDRTPVLVAIGTGGASAGLAKALRLRLEMLLPATLGKLAEGLFAAREALRTRWPDAGDRRRAIDTALGDGGALDPLREDSAAGLNSWLGAEHSRQIFGVIEIRLRSADPEDLTLREARLLGSADVLVYEPNVSPVILNRARADAVRAEIAAGETVSAGTGLTVVLRKDRVAGPK